MDEMPIMRFLGIRIDVPQAVEDGVYVAELAATPDTLNFLGIVHGAAIAALIDHAGGYGARVLTGRGGPTSDLHIRYLGAANEGSVLRAESRVQRAGRTLIIMDVRVTDEKGRLIAVADMAVAPVGEQSNNEPASVDLV
jgi:acyl-CoA thioesterase